VRIVSTTHRVKKSRRGLSLAEVMISLAISAGLIPSRRCIRRNFCIRMSGIFWFVEGMERTIGYSPH